MALTVESGNGDSNADAYLSRSEASSYFSNRDNPSIWTNASDGDKDAAILYATKYLDSMFKWKSNIIDKSQALDWPRESFEDEQEREYGGKVVPQPIKDATAELALKHLEEGLNSTKQEGREIRRERAGSSEIEYFAGSGSRDFGYIKMLVQHLGSPAGKINKLVRA